jgi:hypothetical protein
MKHLLIILISILLLSSPVIGNNHKGETLYQWVNSSGDGHEWREFGDKDIQGKYKGDVENGKPHGLGIFTHTWGDKYVGGWKNGKKHGQGTEIFIFNGHKYVGEYKDNLEWNITRYDRKGNILGKIVNGEYVKQ